MYMIVEVSQYVAVASFSEAWIEIAIIEEHSATVTGVASFSEAWIEILYLLWMGKRKWVASFSEAWIEITISF